SLAEASAELMTSTYVGHLALGAIGLGGWSFDGIDRLSVLGASGEPEVPGLGFRFDVDDRWPMPNPTGRDGVFESFTRQHSGSMEGINKSAGSCCAVRRGIHRAAHGSGRVCL